MAEAFRLDRLAQDISRRVVWTDHSARKKKAKTFRSDFFFFFYGKLKKQEADLVPASCVSNKIWSLVLF